MNRRQRYALTHPLTDPGREALDPYRAVRRHATGLLLATMTGQQLALIDRDDEIIREGTR